MIRKQLRPYQAEAVERWKQRLFDGFGLFHEQRVGKNLPALAILDVEQPAHTLIVTTKKGVKVWNKELRESLDTSDWGGEHEIRVVNFSQLQDKRTYRRLRKWLVGSSLMIVDEAHHIKKRGSKWSRRCRGLGKVAHWRLALTGTPIAQGIWDAWAIFDFLDRRIFGPWTIVERHVNPITKKVKIVVIGGFRFKYCITDPRFPSKITATQNEEEFYEIFHQHCVRKTMTEARREAGMKPVRIRRQILKGELSGDERAHYIALEKDLETVVNRKHIETPLVITLTTKLQQIAGGFLIDGDSKAHQLDRRGPSKMKLLDKAAMPILRQGEKPVIVCRFIHEMDKIDARLRDAGYSVKRVQGGEEFDPTEAITQDAILQQVQLGEAIDLAVASSIIFYSWNYSYIDHEQTRFRVLQYNSTKVSYYFLVMENTIDELILEAIRRKKRVADVVCDYYRRNK